MSPLHLSTTTVPLRRQASDPRIQPVRSARFHIAISRDQGTVVVSVEGDLDVPGARHLGNVLADIIDGQGNMDVVVDLHGASATGAEGVSYFVAAADRASRKAASLSIHNPPTPLYRVLVLAGLGRLVGTIRPDGMRPSPSAPFGRIAAPSGRSWYPAGQIRSRACLKGPQTGSGVSPTSAAGT